MSTVIHFIKMIFCTNRVFNNSKLMICHPRTRSVVGHFFFTPNSVSSMIYQHRRNQRLSMKGYGFDAETDSARWRFYVGNSENISLIEHNLVFLISTKKQINSYPREEKTWFKTKNYRYTIKCNQNRNETLWKVFTSISIIKKSVLQVVLTHYSLILRNSDERINIMWYTSRKKYVK